MKLFLKKHWGLWFIIFIWAAFALPYGIKNNTPYPSSLLVNHFSPWNNLSQYASPVKNPAITDVVDQVYPWKYLVIHEWKQGIIPLWNPYSFSGTPLLANFQSAPFSVINIFFFILPFIDAWTLSILLIPLFAGVSMYLFIKELGMREGAAALSSITFMFCGFMTVWLPYGTLPLAAAFLPLALFSVERYVHTKRIWNLVLLAIAICFSIFAGHFQTTVYVILFLTAYVLYTIFSQKNHKLLILFILFGFFGLLLSAPQLLPSIEFYLYAVRSGQFNGSGGIPLQYLVTIFSPDFFGNPVTGNVWFGQYAEWASFIGVIPLLLAFSALFKKRKSVWFFAIAASVTLLFSLDTPLQSLVGALHIPVLSTSYPARIIVLCSFSLSVLAGFGMDSLEVFRAKYSMAKLTALILGGLVVLAGIWIAIFTKIIPVADASVVKHNMLLPEIFFAAFALLILYIKITKSKYSFSIVLIILLIFAALDSYRFVTKWMPSDSKNLAYQTLPVISALQSTVGNGRVFGTIGTEVTNYYRIPTTDGYDPLYSAWYGEFTQGAINGSFQNPKRVEAEVPPTGTYTDKALDTLGANFIYFPNNQQFANWAYPIWTKSWMKQVYHDDTFSIYNNVHAFSKATLFYFYQTVSDDKNAVETFYNPRFDNTEQLILSENPGISLQKGSGSTSIIHNTANDLKVSVTTSTQALLFVPDNFYPGWSASVDGNATKIYRADVAFRAIVVPKGTHVVELVYKPLSFTIGVILSIIGLVGMIGYEVISKFKNQNLKPKQKAKSF